jgi:hypothetical protein
MVILQELGKAVSRVLQNYLTTTMPDENHEYREGNGSIMKDNKESVRLRSKGGRTNKPPYLTVSSNMTGSARAHSLLSRAMGCEGLNSRWEVRIFL